MVSGFAPSKLQAVVLTALLVLSARFVRADGIVLESFTGARAENAKELLAPIHEELNLRGYVSNDLASRRYESKASRAVADLAPTFEASVEAGHRAWVAGKFDDAIAALTPVIASAHASPHVIAKSTALRAKLFKGAVALALSHHGRGDSSAATATFKEMLRSFPDMPLPKASYGTDAYKLYDDAKRSAVRDGRGTLTVRVPEGVKVAINERFDGAGTVTQPDLIPGTYRVLAELSNERFSRVYRVDVRRDEEAVLTIEPTYDASLHTSTTSAGLVFESAAERERSEVRFATRFATESASSSVIVIGVDQVRGRPAVVGSLIDVAGVRETRRASIAIDPALSEVRLRALARFLAGDKATDGLDVEIGATTTNETPSVAAATSRRWMLFAGIAAVVVGGAVGGGLALKYHFDSKDVGDELLRVCATSCTPDQVRALESKQNAARRNAVISGVAGGAVAVTGLVFIVLSQLGGGNDEPRAVSIVPTPTGVLGTYAITF